MAGWKYANRDDKLAARRARYAAKRVEQGLPVENPPAEPSEPPKTTERLPRTKPRRKFANDEVRKAAKKLRQQERRAELLLPGNEEKLAALNVRRKQREAERRTEQGLPPPQPRTKYANDDERRAAARQKYHERQAQARADAGLPPVKPRKTFTSDRERSAYYREYNKKFYAATNARKTVRKRAEMAETRRLRDEFIQIVEPIVSSRVRTRLLISLCEYGPISPYRIGTCIARSSLPARRIAMQFFVYLGIVAAYKRTPRSEVIYYLNPGHPAHAEILAFGKALAARWPSPSRSPNKVEQVPVPLPTPDADEAFPCNLFRRTEGNQALLLIAVTGGLTPMQVFEDAALLSTWDGADDTLRHFEGVGILAREPVPSGKGAGLGQPRRYHLNPAFFAYYELRALLWALCATVYQDIPGLAESMTTTSPVLRPHIEPNLEKFKAATRHLKDWA